MKALILNKAWDFSYEEREYPVCGPGDVVVKVSAVCICGSDIHAIKGDKTSFAFPLAFGHEVAGTVAEIGPDVTGLAVGDQVCLMPCISCGQCRGCRKGRTNACSKLQLYGVHRDGGTQQYLCTPEKYWIRVPFPARPQDISMIEPLTIGAHAVARAVLEPEDRVLIIGAGPIGVSCAVNARAAGARVLMAETNGGRRDFASKRFQFDILDPLTDTYASQLEDWTGGELFDAVIDTTAVKASMDNAWRWLCQGGHLVYVGINSGTIEIDGRAFHMKEPTLMTTRNSTRRDYEQVLRMWQEGRIDPSLFVTHTVPFDNAPDVLIEWINNPAEVFKGVICFD